MDYLPILIFLLVAVACGLALSLMGRAARGTTEAHPEEPLASESDPDARKVFDGRLHLAFVAFVIASVVVAVLFPWAVAFGEMADLAFWSMMTFLMVLIVAFAYAWSTGALDWHDTP